MLVVLFPFALQLYPHYLVKYANLIPAVYNIPMLPDFHPIKHFLAHVHMFLWNLYTKWQYLLLRPKSCYCQPSPTKFTSISRRVHRLIVHFKQWSCFIMRIANSLLPIWPPNSLDLNPVDYCIWGSDVGASLPNISTGRGRGRWARVLASSRV